MWGFGRVNIVLADHFIQAGGEDDVRLVLHVLINVHVVVVPADPPVYRSACHHLSDLTNIEYVWHSHHPRRGALNVIHFHFVISVNSTLSTLLPFVINWVPPSLLLLGLSRFKYGRNERQAEGAGGAGRGVTRGQLSPVCQSDLNQTVQHPPPPPPSLHWALLLPGEREYWFYYSLLYSFTISTVDAQWSGIILVLSLIFFFRIIQKIFYYEPEIICSGNISNEYLKESVVIVFVLVLTIVFYLLFSSSWS